MNVVDAMREERSLIADQASTGAIL